MISPHGNILVNKIVPIEERNEWLNRAKTLQSLICGEEQIQDVKNIARGVYSPLAGFLKKEDFLKVVSEMRLKDGAVWSIPIVLDIRRRDCQRLKKEKDVVLSDGGGKPIAILEDIEIYKYDKDFLAKNVFQTLDKKHPGVKEVYEMGEYLVGGEVKLLEDARTPFPKYNLAPQETRKIFQERGWKKIVAFQTRNVPHRGHEFLQKYALKEVDGLFIQPVVGKKKPGDFRDEFILASYELLIDKYYPKEKVLLSILPLKMRYAGPREAIFHALIRKNFGCTHFIVGRDHAGVGNYYPPSAAQEIFNNFKKEEIGIEILKYPEVVYCASCKQHVFASDYRYPLPKSIDESIDFGSGYGCSHPKEAKISFSGTKLRESIVNKELLPFHIVRPEISYLLSISPNSLIDYSHSEHSDTNSPRSFDGATRRMTGSGYSDYDSKKGFVVWFTGLSQAGKTTLADRIHEILKERRIRTERLDGDLVRQSLTKDLGFSKKDRDENIRRVGSVAKFLANNGVGVIASFISPYRDQREELKKEIVNFVEVFCNCPIEICERRDTKGLYKKARLGKIKNFTGISDPYETPKSPDIELRTDQLSVEECANEIIRYLEKNKLIP